MHAIFTKGCPQERMSWVNWNRTEIFTWTLTALIKFIRQIQNKPLCKSAILGFKRSLFSPKIKNSSLLVTINHFRHALSVWKARDCFLPCCSYWSGSGFSTGLSCSYFLTQHHTLKTYDFQGPFRSFFDIHMLLFLLLFCWRTVRLLLS